MRKLKKFKLYAFLALTISMQVFLYPSSICREEASLGAQHVRAEVLEKINFEISPQLPKQGQTLSVKINKIKDSNSTPKIFFDKTKYPVFKLSDDSFRAFIPLTASSKVGTHELNIYYGNLGEDLNIKVNDANYKIENLTLGKETAGLKATKIEKDLVNKALSIRSDTKLWQENFSLPSQARQSTPYGIKRRINGVLNPDYFHKGLDFAANTGGLVTSPEDGKVILTGYNSMGFVVNGNCIFLDHGHGIVSAYLHLNQILVKEGDLIKKGQLIGKVGSTGIASGPHLHWGIYVNGKPIDPMWWVNTKIE